MPAVSCLYQTWWYNNYKNLTFIGHLHTRCTGQSRQHVQHLNYCVLKTLYQYLRPSIERSRGTWLGNQRALITSSHLHLFLSRSPIVLIIAPLPYLRGAFLSYRIRVSYTLMPLEFRSCVTLVFACLFFNYVNVLFVKDPGSVQHTLQAKRLHQMYT